MNNLQYTVYQLSSQHGQQHITYYGKKTGIWISEQPASIHNFKQSKYDFNDMSIISWEGEQTCYTAMNNL